MRVKTIIILPALLLFCALAGAEGPALPEFGQIDPNGKPAEATAPPPGATPEQVREIRDKIITSLFFRGELADKVLEAGIQNELVSTEGMETYSEVREALLNWIQKHPDEAANVWFYLKTYGPRGEGYTRVVTEAWWEFNPVFLRLIDDVNKAAKDGSMSREEVSLVAYRLFGGPTAAEDAYAPVIIKEGRGGGRAPQGAGSAGALDYADYKLDPAAAERAAKDMGAMLDALKKALEEDGDKEGLRRAEAAFGLYKDFLVALSGLKGRKNITEAESKKLEELRAALRAKLAALAAASARQRLRARLAALPPGAPGSALLLKEALALIAALGAFTGEDGKAADPRRLGELQRAAEFWAAKYAAYMRLSALKGRAEGAGFSCALDRIVFALLARIAPAAGYVRLRGELAAEAAALAPAMEAVASGDAAGAEKFAGAPGGEALAAKIGGLEGKAAAVQSCSRVNRRLQFLFWDAFLNPPGLAPARRGVSAANKLLL